MNRIKDEYEYESCIVISIIVGCVIFLLCVISGATFLWSVGIAIFGGIALGIKYSTVKGKRIKKARKKRYQAIKQNKEEILLKINSKMINTSDKLFVFYKTGTIRCALAYDNKQQRLCLIDSGKRLFMFESTDITNCDLRTTSRVITEGKTKKKGVVPGAVVGGLIAGGAGAVVGGMTGGEKHKSSSKEFLTYCIDVYTANHELPYFTITGTGTDLKKWYGYILIMIKNANK